ncbi:MAG TPA: hypothetical protein DCM62_05175 [Bacteroidales bacterium]|nr:hypothetical protein [Bacteroidales bacterium]
MKIKSLLLSVVMLVSAGFLGSCTEEEKGNAKVSFQAVNSTTRMKTAPVSGVVINTFKVNIDEIEFEFYDSPSDRFPDGESYSELELEGPFEVDLVREGNTQLTNLVSGITLPQATFDEIEFEFERSENRGSPLHGRSILVRGTINGTPFEYFSTIDEFTVEIEFEPPVDLSTAGGVSVTISVDLAAIFNPQLGGVDISGARDGNGNGTIEIHLLDNDGNRALADRLDDAIWAAIDSIEERYDD